MSAGFDLGVIYASIRLDTSGLTTGIQTVKREFQESGSFITKHLADIESAGQRMSMGITVPLMAAAGASAKFSMDFGESMAKIVGLAGGAADEIDGLRNSVLGLSPDVARSPKELGEALYFIYSSGVKGSGAMDILTQSSKAAAAGLGETKVVADVATSAVNAYGQANITAAQVTDILVAAVREGKGEANEMAGSIGRVLPIAAQMGVDFANVAAAMATMTRSGLDTDEAATALRGTLAALLNPAKQTEKALESVGLTAAGIRKELSENLISGLAHLATAFKGNDELLAQVFPNIRALIGVLNLTGQSAGQVAGIFDAVRNSTGATDDAFKAMEQTAGFKLKQAFARLQVEAIALGDAGSPAINLLSSAVGGLAHAMTELGPVGNGTILIVGAIAASIGPLLMAVGTVGHAIEAWGVISATAAGVFSGPVLASIAAVVAAIVGLVALYRYLNRDTVAEAQAAADSAHAKYDQTEQTKKLVAEYDHLRDKTQRSNTETDRMNSLAEQIVKNSPGLLGAYDAETGRINIKTRAKELLNAQSKQEYGWAVELEKIALKKKIDSLKDAPANAKRYSAGLSSGRVPEAGPSLLGVGTVMNRITSGLAGLDKNGADYNVAPAYAGGRECLLKAAQQATKDAKELLLTQKQLADLDRTGKLPPIAATRPTTSSANRAGGGGGGGKPTKGLSAQKLREMGAENVVDELGQQYDALAHKLGNLLELKDTAGATQTLAEMNTKTQQLVAAYGSLEKAKLAGVKSTQQKKAIELDASNSERAALQAYEGDRKRVSDKQVELAQERERAVKESAEKQAEFEKALAQQQLEYAIAANDKRESAWIEYQNRLSEIASDPNSGPLAEQTALESYLSKMDALLADEVEASKKAADDRLAHELSVADQEYQLGIKSRADYIAMLTEKQNANAADYDLWLELENKKRSAISDAVDEQIRAAERTAEKNKQAAIKMLQDELVAYQAMGDAGIAAAKRIQDAIDELSKKKSKDKESTTSWAHAWTQQIMNIADSFASAMADMITGTGSFKDFIKSAFKDILRMVIDTYIKMVIESHMAHKKMQADAAKTAAANKATGGGGKGGGGWLGTALSIAGLFFDEPTNDTKAVRSGADFARLFRQGAMADIGRGFPSAHQLVQPAAAGATKIIHNTPQVTVTTHIDKVSNIGDIERLSDTQAWIITRKLNLAPTG